MTFNELVKKHENLDTPREIADALWAEHGMSIFEKLSETYLLSILTEQVRQHMSRKRARSFKTTREFKNGHPIPGNCRMGLAGDYWSKKWLVNGTYIETRGLSLDNLDWLINDRMKVSDQMQAQIKFLNANLELAKTHGVTFLGELEQLRTTIT